MRGGDLGRIWVAMIPLFFLVIGAAVVNGTADSPSERSAEAFSTRLASLRQRLPQPVTFGR